MGQTFHSHGTIAAVDRDARTHFRALNMFERLSPRRAGLVRQAIGGAGAPFGRRLYETLDHAFRRQVDVPAIVSIVEALGPALLAREGEPAEPLFWDAVVSEARSQSLLRRRRGSIRSLWGVTPINMLRELVEADRRLGSEAESVVFSHYYITSSFDVQLKPYDDAFGSVHGKHWRAYRYLVLVWSLLRYDHFHLFNDRGLLDPAGGYGSDNFGIALHEMDLYRAAGKKLYTYAYGADHRTRLKTLAGGKFNFCMDCPQPGKFCVCDDVGGERMLSEIRSRATMMLTTGLSVHAIGGSRNLYYTVVDTDVMKPPAISAPATRSSTLRVGHFPNHGFFKGTAYLQKAVGVLQAEGLPIELDLISGVPHAEVIERMQSIDVLVDQLISGAFGLTALEAMAQGKPVICHLRPGVALADLDNCPIIRAEPDTIADVLRSLVAQRDGLSKVGTASREYVVRNYSIDAFARRLAGLYVDTAGLSPPARKHLQGIADGRASPCRMPLPQVIGSSATAAIGIDAAVASLRAIFDLRTHVFDKVAGGIATARAAMFAAVMRPAWVAAQKVFAAYTVLARRLTARRRARGKLRSVWGVTPILTLPLLAQCDRKLGLDARSLVFQTYYITNRFDTDLSAIEKWIARRKPLARHRLGLLFRHAVFAWALLRYDVFHYYYDRGMLHGADRFGISTAELKWLKDSGKSLFVYAYGADVRARAPTMALGSPNLCEECPEPGKFCICDERELSSSVARLQGHATALVTMGDMTAYVPGSRDLHYWPLDTTRFDAVPPAPRMGRPLRVAHAPNHAYFKGTRHLVSAIERLQAEGHAIELVRVQGVPNDEVIRLFRDCDVVADQFVAGFHGYTALEAMALGRPVLCFLRGPDMVIDPDTCPIVNTHPDDVYDVLKDCVAGRIDLAEIGNRSRRYVERYYSIDAVAARLGRLYLDVELVAPSHRDRIAARIAELERGLPDLEPVLPPRPWSSGIGMHSTSVVSA